MMRVNTPVFEGLFTEMNKVTGFNNMLQAMLLVVMARTKTMQMDVNNEIIEEISEKFDLNIELDDATKTYKLALSKITPEEILAQEPSFKVIKGGKNAKS